MTLNGTIFNTLFKLTGSGIDQKIDRKTIVYILILKYISMNQNLKKERSLHHGIFFASV